MVLIFAWEGSSSAFCRMQNLKHSTKDVTITALSDGLVSARLLDKLTNRNEMKELSQNIYKDVMITECLVKIVTKWV